MALFTATIKTTRVVNGERLEKGMNVEFSFQGAPLSSRDGQQKIIDAFQNKYGVDLKKASSVSSAYILVEKI